MTIQQSTSDEGLVTTETEWTMRSKERPGEKGLDAGNTLLWPWFSMSCPQLLALAPPGEVGPIPELLNQKFH